LKFFNKIQLRKKQTRLQKNSGFQINSNELKEFYETFSLLKNDKNEENFEFNKKIMRFIDEDLSGYS